MRFGGKSRAIRSHAFWGRPSIRRVVTGFFFVAAVTMYGVGGFLLQGWGISDSLYMTVTTMSTVGFGEVRPIVTPLQRFHVISLILLGIYSIAYTTAGFVQLIAEGEVRAILGQTIMRHSIDELKDHTIIAGFGRVGAFVCEDLEAHGRPYVVIEKMQERAAELERREILHVIGDATDEQTLLLAGVDRARTIVCVMPSDANNVFVALTARQISPEIEIIARAEQPSTTKTLHQAGARHVVMPAAIGAHRIAALLTRPKAAAYADMVSSHAGIGLEIAEITIGPGCSLLGKSVVEADVSHRTGVHIAAVRQAGGEVRTPVPRDLVFGKDDCVMVIGKTSDLERFRAEYGLPAWESR